MSELTDRLSTALADRYRIERELGAGGMATVYLAEDLKHDRKVALKVLRPELAAVLGAERLVQEIKTTASLQHPHILPLFDSGTAGSAGGLGGQFLYYVMPYIEGETLRDKLNRETQLGIDEAVKLTTAIADALDYAHRHNVIHRDIKPENILLHDGRPMVADFGIALAVSAAAGGRMTETGLSLGTPHYMSPEQATAEKDLTNRSDIYSLGSVLYEMLTGEPPHVGGSAQAIIMKIVTEDAQPVTRLRKSVPAHIAAATAQSLEKLPADRFESASSFAAALNDPHFTSASAVAMSEPGLAPSSSRTVTMMGWGVAAVLALILGVTVLRPEPTVAPLVPVRFTLDVDHIPASESDGVGVRLGEIVVSPDGSLFAVPTFPGIYLRSAGGTSYRLLPNTERAIHPAFSPDGKWLVFIREGVLVKSAVDGSAEQTLLRSNTVIAARPNWGYPGTIVFQSQGGLYRISDNGGDPELLGGAPNGRYPSLLPDGSGVLYHTPAGVMVLAFGADSGRSVVPRSTNATYLPTGHVAYVNLDGGGLFVVPFDLQTHTVTGPPISVVGDVSIVAENAYYSISQTGTLIYATNPLASGTNRHLLLLNLSGGIDTIPLAPRTFNWPRFSPDGRMLSFNTGAGRIEQRTVYTYDLALGNIRQVTSGGGAHAAAWSPDGSHIVFSSERTGTVAEDLFITAVGNSAEVSLPSLPGDEHAMAWVSDDLIVETSAGMTDLMLVDPSNPERPATPYLNAEWVVSDLSVSPTGDRAAYESDESGRPEVYVRAFPHPGGARLISANGGMDPKWSPDGETVYYWALSRDTIFAVSVPPDAQSSAPPRVVAVVPRVIGQWDVDRVSGRAVVQQASEEHAQTAAEVVVVVNWFEELKARVGN